jgi:hypothetical protein
VSRILLAVEYLIAEPDVVVSESLFGCLANIVPVAQLGGLASLNIVESTKRLLPRIVTKLSRGAACTAVTFPRR